MQVFTALMAVYLFWGGTYLAMKVAVDTIPPFLMSGLRFFTAGALVYLWEWRKGASHPKKAEWLGAARVGGLLLVISMGGLVWAEQFVPSGIAAIIFATVPLWMALISWFFHNSRPELPVITGLMLGFGGVILLVSNSLTAVGSNHLEWLGYIVVTLASVAWAWGSLYSRTARLPESPVLAVALQNLTGGACYILISLLSGEFSTFSPGSVSLESAISLLYLIIFGSIIGFAAYIWLLKVADATIVSTYAYVNPVVAVFLGWTLAGERLVPSDAIAAVIILCAVIMISKKEAQTT
jgi:drug/metabolite transporter (DMT)-like permease